MSRNQRGKSKLTALHQGLADVIGAQQLAVLSVLARLRRAWPQIVGPMMAVRTEPLQLEPLPEGGMRLWVGVDHAIMAQQIRFLHQDIRKACFTHCRIKELAQIRTRVLPGAGIKPEKPKQSPRSVRFAERRKVASEVKSIKDHALRRAAFQARLAQIAYGEPQSTDKEMDG